MRGGKKGRFRTCGGRSLTTMRRPIASFSSMMLRGDSEGAAAALVAALEGHLVSCGAVKVGAAGAAATPWSGCAASLGLVLARGNAAREAAATASQRDDSGAGLDGEAWVGWSDEGCICCSSGGCARCLPGLGAGLQWLRRGATGM